MHRITLWPFMILLLGGLACKSDRPAESSPTQGEVIIGCDVQIKELMLQQEMIFEQQYKHADVHLQFYNERDLIRLWMSDSFRTVIMGRPLDSSEILFFQKQKQVTPRHFPFAIGAISLISLKTPSDTNIRYEQLISILQGKSIDRLPYKSLVIEDASSGIAPYLLQWAGIKEFNQNVYALEGKEAIFKYLENHPKALAVMDWTAFSDSDDREAMNRLQRFRVIAIDQPKDSIQYGFVLPEQYNLQDHKYPLQRDWHFISCSGKSDLGLGFASFVAGEIGQRIILKAGLLPVYQTERWVEWIPGDYKIVN